MKKIISVVLAGCLLSVTLTGCFWNKEPEKVEQREKRGYEDIIRIGDIEANPKKAIDRKDTLIVGVNDIKGVFNPIMASDTYDQWVCDLVFEGLLSHDENGNVVPNLAESYDITDDGKAYNFKLRKGVKFSDGTEVTTADIAFTYTALCDPSYTGPYKIQFSTLEGYDEYRRGKAEEVIGIDVRDEYNISFHFTQGKASLIYSFEMPILPKNYYNFAKGDIEKIRELEKKPLGCGAYKLDSYTENQNVAFEKNENYFKGLPVINNILIKRTPGSKSLEELANGSIDMTRVSPNVENVKYIKSLGFADLRFYDNNGYQYIGLNLRLDKFKDKRVRQGLLYGLDREKFVKDYYGEFGSVTNTPFARSSWAYPGELNEYKFDKVKSEKLLEEAGWIKKEDGYRYNSKGEKLSINWLTYEGNKYVEALISVVVENWKNIGVEVTVNKMPFQQLVQQIYDERQFEMYNMSWILTADPDPSPMFSRDEDLVGGYNAVGWRNEESEKLLQQALKETDTSKRKEIYKQWASLAAEELPYLYLNQNKDMYAVNMRVSGLKLSPYRDWTKEAYLLKLVSSDNN